MTIAPRPAEGDYDQALFDFILEHEAFVPRVYTDHRGIPTLGVGYALVVAGDGWRLRHGLDAELGSIGVQLSAADQALLDQARMALAEGAADRAKQLIPPWSPGEDSSSRNRFSFQLTGDQGRALFDLVRPGYERIVEQRLGDPLYRAFEGSREMIALFSLAYNNPALIGRGLVDALERGNRVEAWYEIRFRSNAKRHSGLQDRRGQESDMFGLYDAGAAAQEVDAALTFLDTKRSAVVRYLSQVRGGEDAARGELDQLIAVAQAGAEGAAGPTRLA